MEEDETEVTNADTWNKFDDVKSSNLQLNNVDKKIENAEESLSQDSWDDESFDENEEFHDDNDDDEDQEQYDEDEEEIKSSTYKLKSFKNDILINDNDKEPEKINISVYPAMEKKEIIINKTPAGKLIDNNQKLVIRNFKSSKIKSQSQYHNSNSLTIDVQKNVCLRCKKSKQTMVNSEMKNNTNICHCKYTIKTKNNHSKINNRPSTSLQNLSVNDKLKNIANKFKISRKVYKCATCETYFENWNLFIHMREIHNRHICLFCLGLFGAADRLSQHLEKQHRITGVNYDSVDDFYHSFIGSCYLICCSCEKIFTESDNFYNHYCQIQTNDNDKLVINPVNIVKYNKNNQLTAINNNNFNIKKKIKTKNRISNHDKKLLSLYKRNVTNDDRKVNNITNNNINSDNNNIINNVPTDDNTLNLNNTNDNNTFIKKQNNSINDIKESIKDDKKNCNNDNLSEDTVAETIFQVSKCFDENNDTAIEKQSSPILSDTFDNNKKIIINNHNNEKTVNAVDNEYDSVTETIMRVSKCINDDDDATDNGESMNKSSDSHQDNNKKQLSDHEDSNEMSKLSEFSKNNESNIWKHDTNHLSSSSSSSNSSSSADENYDEDDDDDDDNNESNKNKSVASVSSVNTNDRRLVIKICTNKNSSFHVSATSNGINIPSESDEKNNLDCDNNDNKPSNEKLKSSSPIQEQKQQQHQPESSPVRSSLDTSTESPTKNNDNQLNQQINYETKEKAEEPVIEPLSFLPTTGENNDINNDEMMIDDKNHDNNDNNTVISIDNGIKLVSDDMPSLDIDVVATLDATDIVDLLRSCIKAACSICIYCNHARQIAVDGKQLALHMLAEHNFQPQHPAIIIEKYQFIQRVKKSLDELSNHYINLETYDSKIGTYNITKTRRYECFYCRITSLNHKDVYQHNRKIHQKMIIICIMCKLSFYSYSELLCHLCPGTDKTNSSMSVNQFTQIPSLSHSLNDIKYRCCNCSSMDILPSAFRLMVHLRRAHHTCDICLETTTNQHKLSNHIMKHKIIHPCFRCGISYRNKPDFKNHLYWKHGTESVDCKKCLQKKWPHIYHFCTPPNEFTCDECNIIFKKAVALKVHKRIHTNHEPYECNICFQKFISKKALGRHDIGIHNPPEILPPLVIPISCNNGNNNNNNNNNTISNEISDNDKPETMNVDNDSFDNSKNKHLKTSEQQQSKQINDNNEIIVKKSDEHVKKVIDVYDLPPLNLSSDSDSDTDNEMINKKNIDIVISVSDNKLNDDNKNNKDEEMNKSNDDNKNNEDGEINKLNDDDNTNTDDQQVTIMNGIWNNFKSYRLSLGTEDFDLDAENKIEEEKKRLELIDIIIDDHDYCIVYSDSSKIDNSIENNDAEKKIVEKNEEKIVDENETKNIDEKAVVNTEIIEETKTQLPDIENKPAENTTENEKKETKSPKKKNKEKTDGSSSSSDSGSTCCSSDNCSCTTSSSDSSSSSSSSSDSESSNKKKNKTIKQNNIKESYDGENMAIDETNKTNKINQDIPPKIPSPIPDSNEENQKRIIDAKLILRHSDLDTTETETDEDFYDEHPQKLALQLLEEKRNQLLASVPQSEEPIKPLQNGTTDDTQKLNSSPKKKTRGRKRKKGTRDSRLARGAPKGPRGRKAKLSDCQINPTQHHQHFQQHQQQQQQQQLQHQLQLQMSKTIDSFKLNIPNSKAYRAKQKIRFSLPNNTNYSTPSPSSTPAYDNYAINNSYQTTPQQNHSYSGSESETKRSSKRRRKPKRFYDDSSDEEAHLHEKLLKFRRTDPPPLPPPLPPSFPLEFNHTYPALSPQHNTIQQVPSLKLQPSTLPPPPPTLPLPLLSPPTEQEPPSPPLLPPSTALPSSSSPPPPPPSQPLLPTSLSLPPSTPPLTLKVRPIRIKHQLGGEPMIMKKKSLNIQDNNSEEVDNLHVGSVSDSDDANDSSSDSNTSDSYSKMQIDETPMIESPIPVDNFSVSGPTSGAKLYCYCRCPYDEVSEMIACDSKNCKIEWFHFDCVKIKVPPKGNWFCPNCKKTDPNATQ